MLNYPTLPFSANLTSKVLGLEADSVQNQAKGDGSALARGIICHLAIFEFGFLDSEVGKFLYLGSSGAMPQCQATGGRP